MISPDRQLELPDSIVTRADLTYLIAELEQLEGWQIERTVHQKIEAAASQPPAYSIRLSDFLQLNQLDVEQAGGLSQLIVQLRQLKATAPIVHMTFSAQVDESSRKSITNWMRQSVHRQALLSIGLQPGLLGGVYIRTTNLVQDFSLRKQLLGKRQLLVGQIKGLNRDR